MLGCRKFCWAMTDRDAEHDLARNHEDWLSRHSAQGWIEAGLKQLTVAQQAFEQRQGLAAAVALKRAAGMALNGALRVVPRPEWGRSYVAHLEALTSDERAPEEVSAAARELLRFAPAPGNVVLLRTRALEERLLESARIVMAHAYAIVNGSVGRGPELG